MKRRGQQKERKMTSKGLEGLEFGLGTSSDVADLIQTPVSTLKGHSDCGRYIAIQFLTARQPSSLKFRVFNVLMPRAKKF